MIEAFRVPVQVALAAPAARMVVVEAWSEGGVAREAIHPVVAIRSVVE